MARLLFFVYLVERSTRSLLTSPHIPIFSNANALGRHSRDLVFNSLPATFVPPSLFTQECLRPRILAAPF